MKLKKIRDVSSEKPEFSEVKDWFDKNMAPSVINFDDPEPYKVYEEGKWCGVFQCVDENSLVLMEDGSQKKITDVKVGDVVISYDENNKALVSSEVERIFDQGVKECIELKLPSGEKLICTPDHLVLTSKGWIEAQHLPSPAQFRRVGKKHVYDLEIKDTHNFVANGIVVHNCTSRGAQQFFIKAKPKSIVDIAALTSIYRPGPLAAKVDDLWLKHEWDHFDWGHPLINDTLSETRGCLAEGTLITTNQGQIPIEKIVEEQLQVSLPTLNENTGKFEDDVIVASVFNGVQDTLEINLENGKKLILTPDHRVLTKNGWKRADELTVEDEIISYQTKKAPVEISCAFCGKKTFNKRFCSIACICRFNNSLKTIHHYLQRICATCKKEYTVSSCVKTSKCCSRQCLNEYKKVHYKGRKITPTWLANMNEGKRRENIVKYGDFSCEKCQKKFDTNLSLRAHRSYCNRSDDPTPVQCQICQKILKSQRSLKTHVNKHDPEWLKKHSENVSKSLANRKIQKRISDEETAFYQILCKIYGDEVIHSFRINEINHEFDFYVPSQNLLIEYDGDYWHGNKNRYKLTQKMKKQYQIDIEYTKQARDLGYVVHRVWGSESSEYPQKIREI